MCNELAPPVTIQTSPEAVPSIPPLFAQVVLLAHAFAHHGYLAAISEQVRLARGRAGHYDVLDFVAGELSVVVPVTNTGERAGQAVVQLYVGDVAARRERPAKELKAFAKATLQPGETQELTLGLNMRSLAYFDDARHAWVADAGDFALLIGTSSADLPLRATLRLTGEWSQPMGM